MMRALTHVPAPVNLNGRALEADIAAAAGVSPKDVRVFYSQNGSTSNLEIAAPDTISDAKIKEIVLAHKGNPTPEEATFLSRFQALVQWVQEWESVASTWDTLPASQRMAIEKRGWSSLASLIREYNSLT